MLNGRNRTAASLAAFALTGALALSVSTPATAEPDVDTVRDRVEKLLHQAEQASERYNDARLDLAALNRDLSSLKADQTRQGESLDGVRSEVRATIIQRYQNGGLGPTGDLLASDSESFLDGLSTKETVDGLHDALLSDYDDERAAYGIRESQTEKRREAIVSLKAELAEEKKEADDKLAKAKSLLSRLEAAEREDVLSRGGGRAPAASSIPASGRAKAAIAYALAQVGDRYVFGAAGPDAFDCSGLMMRAWGAAGVSLPHSSRAQAGVGTSISRDQLQPGDLVFYYSPISHVGMYLGNGMIVHAANPGAGVKVSSVDEMPYAGAVRPG